MTGGACMSEIKDKSEEQKAAEAEVESFRKDRGPFVVAADTTRMPMVFMDAREPGNPIIFANESFLTLTGYDREEVLGQSFNFLMAQGADPKALALIEAAFVDSTDHSSATRYAIGAAPLWSISRHSWTSPSRSKKPLIPR
jgi:PAS domain-containing protein